MATATSASEVEVEDELARAQRAVAAADDERADDERADKVAQLKRQIEAGTYNVPTETLADKLLDLNGGQ